MVLFRSDCVQFVASTYTLSLSLHFFNELVEKVKIKNQNIFSLDNMLIINVNVGFVLDFTRLEGSGKVPKSD